MIKAIIKTISRTPIHTDHQTANPAQDQAKSEDEYLDSATALMREAEFSGFLQGVTQGLDKGLHVGRMMALHEQMMMRFGRLPDETDQRVLNASSDEIDDWLGNILIAQNIEDVFKVTEEETDTTPTPGCAKPNMH